MKAQKIFKYVYVAFLIFLATIPFIPSLMAEFFIWPLDICERPLWSSSTGNNINNSEFCNHWGRLAFAAGWLIIITYPMLMLIAVGHVIYTLVKSMNRQ